jgi:hypothetical protein
MIVELSVGAEPSGTKGNEKETKTREENNEIQ